MLPLSPEFLNGFAGAALGLIAGSFLATLLIRWPDGLNAAKGRSRCDSCARALAWHELIPLVSFAIAGGRCRTCRAPISLLHPAVEATCAAAGAVCFAAGWPERCSASSATLVKPPWVIVPMTSMIRP